MLIKTYRKIQKIQLTDTCRSTETNLQKNIAFLVPNRPCYGGIRVKCTAAIFFLYGGLVQFYQRGSCHAIHLGLDLFGLFQKTAKLGDGYDDRNSREKPFSFTEKETFSGVNILTASEVCMDTGILCSIRSLNPYAIRVQDYTSKP